MTTKVQSYLLISIGSNATVQEAARLIDDFSIGGHGSKPKHGAHPWTRTAFIKQWLARFRGTRAA